uniref:Uncharacterized protein n=1 Tax=Wuchereria bancrofti TaxID=6293 RepID=A0AAF5Q6J5_WUCBA
MHLKNTALEMEISVLLPTLNHRKMLTRIQIHPGNIHRSQVTRTFHNGTLRASRTWRGVSIRSRGHNSEPISQRLTEYFVSNES